MKQFFNKLKKIIIENYKWIIFAICIIILLFLIEDIMDNDIMAFDERGYSLVAKYLISDNRTSIAKCITNMANMFMLIGIAIVLALLIKNKKIGICIFINLGLSAITNYILKQILRRPRPEGYRIIDEKGYSLPSGHSMVSMAFYGFLIYLIYKKVENKYLKNIIIPILSILILGIGISRIYLGVHYTSDVIAGFIVAITYLIIYIHIIEKYFFDRKNRKEKSNINE